MIDKVLNLTHKIETISERLDQICSNKEPWPDIWLNLFQARYLPSGFIIRVPVLSVCPSYFFNETWSDTNQKVKKI